MTFLVAMPYTAAFAALPEVTQFELALEKPELPPVAIGKQLELLVEKNPTDAQLRYLLGKYLARQGFETLAQEQFSQALKLNAQHVPALYNRCLILMRSGQTAQGAVEIAKCVQSNRLSAEQLLQLAKALEIAGMVPEAQSLYARAGQGGKLGTGAALAQSYNRRGLYQQALLSARQDLAIDSNYIPANLELANALVGLHRESSALEPLQRMFDSDPLNGKVAERLARSLYHEGRNLQALTPALYALGTSVDRSSRMRPNKALLQSILPLISTQDAARVVNQVSNRLNDTRYAAFFHFALGDVFDKLRRPAEARQQFESGLAIDPNFGRAIFRLGRIEELAYGRYNLALACYKRAHDLEPFDREIAMRYRGLQNQIGNSKQDLAWQVKSWLIQNVGK